MTSTTMFNSNLKPGGGVLAMFVAATIFTSGGIAQAMLLNSGAILTLRSAHEPQGAHLLATTNFAFTSASFTGTLTSKVWADDDANPWLGLTFTYRLANTGDCLEALGLFTLGGFGDSLVDVNYSGFGIAPRQASRSSLGERIAFGFFDRDGDETLLPGDTSAWLVIQTDGDTWGVNQLIGMDTMEIAAATFGPVVVPEPSIGALVLLASAGRALRLRRNRVRSYGSRK